MTHALCLCRASGEGGLETQARIGRKSFRSQPIASGLFVACGYGHVIGPGVAEQEGSTEFLVILRRARSWLNCSLSVLPLFILLRVVLMQSARN